MARSKSTPAIVKGRSVSLEDGTILVAGDEDKLKPHLTAESIKMLTTRGVIEGTWSPAPSRKAKDAAAADKNKPPASVNSGRAGRHGRTPDASDVQALAEADELAQEQREEESQNDGADGGNAE